jgi:uncharacterized protein (TIGR02145 family)
MTKPGNCISASAIIFGVLLILTFSCKKDDLPSEPMTDIQGNIYKTVRIGTRVWMAENLRTVIYNDGTNIPLITDAARWRGLTTGGYCWYNNDETSYKDPYGAIYNGYAANSGKLCPTGWHVPQVEEWQELRHISGDSIKGGGTLKEAGTTHWLSPNKGADNSTGFSALGSGIRYFEGSFSSHLYFNGIWSASETGTNDQWYMSLYFGDATLNIGHVIKTYGFSVRCIKDE